jgi:hypothetical protein
MAKRAPKKVVVKVEAVEPAVSAPETQPVRCYMCGRGSEDVEINKLVTAYPNLVCCDLVLEPPAALPDLPLFTGRYSDSERLDRLEALLRADGRVVEFWFDDDPSIVWAGDQPGDTLRQALDDLIDADQATV